MVTKAAAPRAIDAAAIGAFVVYSAVMWWPTRDLPYFWDSAGFIVVAARDMFRHGFWPLVPTHEFYAHPPLFVALVAAAWRVFGESRVVAHAVVAPFLALAMSATYLLGVRAHGRLLGLAAASLFGATAVTLCELGQIYFDLPVAAIAASGLLAWVSRRPVLAGVLFAIAAWTKVPAGAVPPLLAVALLFDPSRRKDRWQWIGLAIPVGATIAWFLYHYAVTGWWLTDSPEPLAGPSSGPSIVHRTIIILRIVLLERYRWGLLVLAAVGGVILLRRRDRLASPYLAPLVAAFAGPLAVFTLSTFLTRYLLVVLPAYLVGTLLLARRALPTGVFAGAVVVLLGAFATTWHPRIPLTSDYEIEPNQDLSYLDMIQIGRRAAAYVERKHGDAEIYGGFHAHYELAEPFQGYVTRPLDVRHCGSFSRDRAEQLVFIDAYSPEEALCRLVVRKTGAQALTRFESNGKWREIWRVPSP
ncbi:MAG: ArnT family glycosyltransferase [Polyangiaceae bacterium]